MGDCFREARRMRDIKTNHRFRWRVISFKPDEVRSIVKIIGSSRRAIGADVVRESRRIQDSKRKRPFSRDDW